MIPIQLLFLQNMLAVSYGPLTVSWFSATWSLAVEEQFYLISPVLVHRLSKRTLYAALIGIIVMAPGLRLLVPGVTLSIGKNLG